MCGLEASHDHSCASPQSRAAAQKGYSADAATGLATANCLIAPGAGCRIPSLAGVPDEYRLVEGVNAVAALGKSLLDVGLAKAHTWIEMKGDPFRFLEHTVQHWLDENGSAEIEREFFLDVGLVSDLDSCGAQTGDTNSELYLTFEPDSAGYVVLGPTLRALERVHLSLPVTFFGYFTEALNRWVRVYDHRDAAERVEQLREWYASDADAESVELPDVDGAIPRFLQGRQRPLSERTVQRLAGTVRNRKIRALLEGVLELRATAAKSARPEVSEQAMERLADSNPPVPALVAVFEKHDAIEGCFNDEAQGMLECTPEPNVMCRSSFVTPRVFNRRFRR
jgi:hypothetical protein